MNTQSCTMPTAERTFRLAEFDTLFESTARSVTRDETGVRIHLVGTAGLRERVRDLAERETACCSFFTFLIEGEDSDLVLGISVPPERHEILTALADRAAEAAA